MAATDIRDRFQQLYGTDALVVRAPGRVNLIGEHTDYNDGFVMPAAIDFYTWVAAAPRKDRKLMIHSQNLSETVTADLDHLHVRASGHWSTYPLGVAIVLEQAGYQLRGANLLIDGDVPLGAGLSSSASIEVATGYALVGLSDLAVDHLELAKLCLRAENEFVGTRCGIMDQFVSCFAEAGRALLLDCRSLAARHLPLPAGLKLVICNSMVKRGLVDGDYNRRRAECEEGIDALARVIPGVSALRDVTLSELERHRQDLPQTVYRRCRHVISENARVLEAAGALERSDPEAFGRLMAASHRSLQSDYEVSCRELDMLVELAAAQPGVCGSRMTGGGFGGCTINMVRETAVADFRHAIAKGYARAMGLTPEIYVCTAAQGAGRVA